MSMKILFVDDDSQRLAEVRSLLQQSHLGVAAAFASHEDEASQQLGSTNFDVVVAGVDSPRSVGARVISDAEEEYPGVARLVHSKSRAARDHIGAHLFLSRPFTAQQLRQALYGTVRWRDRMGTAHISDLVAGARELPQLPDVYRRIQAELNSPDPSMHRVGEIIQTDPATSIRILRVVNSALFGLRTEVGDVVQATSLLGMQTISSLALAAGLFANSNLDRRFLEGLWIESLKVGSIARRIAADLELSRRDIEEAQLGGLLHDIGNFVMFQNWPQDFLAVDPTDQLKSELMLFGATHADIGGYLTAVWELPVGVVDAVTNHHTPDRGRFPNHPSPVTAVHAARALLDAEGDPEGAALDMEHLRTLGRRSSVERWAGFVTNLG
jgi:HD-like signal output (HDOD) protein/CheY-like chemotaxis protein